MTMSKIEKTAFMSCRRIASCPHKFLPVDMSLCYNDFQKIHPKQTQSGPCSSNIHHSCSRPRITNRNSVFGRYPKFGIPLFCYMIVLILVPADLRQILECPKECRCVDKGSIMTCTHSHLKEVPKLLSTTLFLDLDYNKLRQVINGSFADAPRIEILTIQDNEIHAIQTGAFQDLTDLRMLRLGNNHLSTLPVEVFSNNKKLEILDLHGNYFPHVPDSVMFHLHNLQLLNLSYNEITSPYLGPGFQYTTQLKSIDLSGNNIPSLESSVFQSTLWWDEGIRHALNLSYCNIRHIHPFAFGKLYRLQVLSLAGNPHISDDDLYAALKDLEVSTLTSLNLSWMNLTEIYELFQRFQHRNLLELYLAHNNIETIKQGTFFYLEKLKHLDLSYNSITDIGDLNSLSKLEYLSLAFNTIEKMTVTTFEGLHNLKTLDLSHNSLGEITDAPFQTLFYLNSLDVSCNLINKVTISTGLEHLQVFKIRSNRLLDTDFVSQLPRLHVFDASDNSLTVIGAFMFSEGQHLKVVNMSYNVINKLDRMAFASCSMDLLDLSHNELRILTSPSWAQIKKLYLHKNNMYNMTPNALSGLLTLQDLYLSQNQLHQLPKFIFKDVQHLQKLDLSHNPIQNLEDCDISTLTSVEILHLSDIQITGIPHSLLSNLTLLRVLDLSNNPLHHLPGFSPLPSLYLLNLSNTGLAYPDPIMFSHQPSLQLVDLTGNPFQCTCQLMPFRYWLLSTNISHHIQFHQNDEYICSSPPEWAGIHLRDFYVEGTTCSPHEKAVIFTAVGGTLVAVLMTLVIAIYKCKCWQARKFDPARYLAIDDRLDHLDQQQEQRLMPRDISSSPTTSSEVNNHSSSPPKWS